MFSMFSSHGPSLHYCWCSMQHHFLSLKRLSLCRSAAGAHRHRAKTAVHVGFRSMSDGGRWNPGYRGGGGAGGSFSSLSPSAAEHGSRSDKLAESRVEVRP